MAVVVAVVPAVLVVIAVVLAVLVIMHRLLVVHQTPLPFYALFFLALFLTLNNTKQVAQFGVFCTELPYTWESYPP